MKKKSFIRVFGMVFLIMMCSLALNAQPRAIISDHLDPAVLVNSGDTIKKDVLNYLNDKGRDDSGWRRGFVYIKNGGLIYVDMRHLSQFDHWRNGDPNPVVKIDPVLDQRGSTINHFRYVDKSGKSQDLELVVIPYNVPMLHSKGAVYELDPRKAAALPASLTELKMAREPINAFYEYRITDDRQLDDYIIVQDLAQGKTGIRGSNMTIDYRMPTPEAPYDMRESVDMGGDYDFGKGVSIAQMRAISQLHPHTEASMADPNSKGIDSLDFTVRISSRAIAGGFSRYLSNESGGTGYFTYIRVIDQRRRSYSLSSNIAVLDGYSSGNPYTPAVTAPDKVRVLIDGESLATAHPLYGKKAKVKVDIINDPDELYTIHSVVTNKGKVLYRIGETQIGNASPHESFRSLTVYYLVSTDEEFIVTLTQARKLVTVRSSDASLGEVAVSTSWEDSFDAVKTSWRAISDSRMTLYVKPKANASFVGWRIDGVNQLFTLKTDELTERYVDFRTDPSRLYYDVLSDGTLRAGVDVKRSLTLEAVFERKAPAKATLSVGVSADGSGSVSINGETQTSITVDQGKEVLLEARANEGYIFSHWKNSDGTQVGTTAKLTYTVKKDETLIAVFDKNAPAKATLRVVVSADGSGTVSINGETQTSITADQGTKVILEAQANKGYVFSHWENGKGTRVETTAKLTYTVEKDETLTAVFEAVKPVKKSTLTVGVSPERSGSVSINGETQTSITVEQGKEVALEAQANKGYNFSHWKNSEGRQVGTTAKLTYKVEKDETLTAVFEAVKPVKKSTLTVGVSPERSGSVSINGETQTSITVEQGKEVALEAQANKGYNFSHWKNSEGRQVGTTAKLTYKVEKDETLTAVFEAKITPRVDEVKVLTGQRDAILTWDAGSATSWQIKLYQAGQILGNPIVTQVPRVELGNLKPGQGYTYEIFARSQGMLDSESKKATFTTEKFNEAEAITPYLKGFSQFRGGQAFDLIWMDVNPTEFVSETPIYRYYWQATPTSELVPLTPSGKQLTLDANRRGGRLIVKILSGNDQLYEIGYDLNQ